MIPRAKVKLKVHKTKPSLKSIKGRPTLWMNYVNETTYLRIVHANGKQEVFIKDKWYDSDWTFDTVLKDRVFKMYFLGFIE